MRKKTGINEWHEEERPRERLLAKGARCLTDAELVAIILRVGIEGKSAVDMAREIIAKFHSLYGLVQAKQEALLDIKGMKTAKVAQLLAAMEIARRVEERGDDRDHKTRIINSETAKSFMRQKLIGYSNEHFCIVYLNRQNIIINSDIVAEGDVATVTVPLRKIISQALMLNASGLIAAHNHPSGDIHPSPADRQLTKDLITVTRPLSIKVLDHVIVGDKEAYSFADEGLMGALEQESKAPGQIQERKNYTYKSASGKRRAR